MLKRILVVDDEAEIVRLAQGYLRKAGFEVLGEESLRSAQASQLECAL